MERIGIRELRQHASRYLRRVQLGESLEITDRGRPVALLVPVRADSWEDRSDSQVCHGGTAEELGLGPASGRTGTPVGLKGPSMLSCLQKRI